MNIFHTHSLYLKNEAAVLLKHVQQDGSSQQEAIARFHQLKSFAVLSSNDPQMFDSLKLKHALSVIAIENGYESWAELKSALDIAAVTSPLAEITDQFYPKGWSAFTNNWFANYKKAKDVLIISGGFLFPFKHHFFICEDGFVERLGLSPSMPEWKMIGFDWVHPAHVKTWLKLNEMYVKVIAAR